MDLFKSRIKKINQVESNTGQSALYVMSRDQRVHDNHAMIAMLKHAEALKVEPVVVFNFYSNIKNRSYNQYEWMVEGLKEVEHELNMLGIRFVLNLSKFDSYSERFKDYLEAIKSLEPTTIYFDFSPLKGSRNLQKYIAQNINTPCYIVDTHNIVPIWVSSDKEEFAAATFRPKIYKHLQNYIQEPESISQIKYPRSKTKSAIEWNIILKSINNEKINNYKPVVKSGSNNANLVLYDFIKNKLKYYSEKRNMPDEEFQSNLSAYLHFGQISSLRIALQILRFAKQQNIEIEFNSSRNKAAKPDEINNDLDRIKSSIEAFLEELIVRKELCDNFCYFNKNYDNKLGGKKWALESLNKHEKDKREFVYTFEELAEARTHDSAWNAAQLQMVRTGKMHGYMRMYWAKKILEWTDNVETAIEYAIKLNDKYELDGYDPNGYVGILWSMVGLHDRPWFERDIFGQIRYMNYDGLKRKFNIEDYIRNINKPI